MGYTLQFGTILSSDLNLASDGSPLAKAADRGKFDEEGYYVITGHGGKDAITGEPIIRNEHITVAENDKKRFLAENGIPYSKDNAMGALITLQGQNAEALAEQIKRDPRYKPGQAIKLQSCENAALAMELSKLLPNTNVMGATTNVVDGGFKSLFTKRGYYLKDNGNWNTYRNGSLISSKAGGWGAETGW